MSQTETSQHPSGHEHGDKIHMPANTAWPFVLAFGLTMAFGGILLGKLISIVGLVLTLVSVIGWFRDVLPHESAEYIDVTVQPFEAITQRPAVERMKLPAMELPEHQLIPNTTLIAGLKGGIVGGIAMALVVLIFGQIVHGSIWYGVNLLGGIGILQTLHPTLAQIDAFHLGPLIVALIIHAAASVLMGLVYGAMLPMLPSRPILLGGLVAPVIWTVLLYALMGVLNPTMEAWISWPWFIASQIIYGLVAGWVVAHDENFKRTRKMPIAMRMGLEAPGLMHENHEGDSH